MIHYYCHCSYFITYYFTQVLQNSYDQNTEQIFVIQNLGIYSNVRAHPRRITYQRFLWFMKVGVGISELGILTISFFWVNGFTCDFIRLKTAFSRYELRRLSSQELIYPHQDRLVVPVHPHLAWACPRRPSSLKSRSFGLKKNVDIFLSLLDLFGSFQPNARSAMTIHLHCTRRHERVDSF